MIAVQLRRIGDKWNLRQRILNLIAKLFCPGTWKGLKEEKRKLKKTNRKGRKECLRRCKLFVLGFIKENHHEVEEMKCLKGVVACFHQQPQKLLCNILSHHFRKFVGECKWSYWERRKLDVTVDWQWWIGPGKWRNLKQPLELKSYSVLDIKHCFMHRKNDFCVWPPVFLKNANQFLSSFVLILEFGNLPGENQEKYVTYGFVLLKWMYFARCSLVL